MVFAYAGYILFDCMMISMKIVAKCWKRKEKKAEFDQVRALEKSFKFDNKLAQACCSVREKM